MGPLHVLRIGSVCAAEVSAPNLHLPSGEVGRFKFVMIAAGSPAVHTNGAIERRKFASLGGASSSSAASCRAIAIFAT